VFLGVHFPLDMAGAVGVAAAAYGVVTPLWRALGASFTGLVERLYRYLLARPIAMGWIRG
jgi:undecaprenyl-diphosphatase